VIKLFKRFWNWLRFGKVTSEVKSVDGGFISEIAYYDRKGRVIG